MVHADINPDKEEAEFLELRFPAPEGHGPSFRAVGQFPGKENGGRWILLASGRLYDHALLLRAPSRVWGARIEAGEQLHANLDPRASCYIVAGSGRSVLGDNYVLEPGDGLALQEEREATIRAIETAEILLVESL